MSHLVTDITLTRQQQCGSLTRRHTNLRYTYNSSSISSSSNNNNNNNNNKNNNNNTSSNTCRAT